MAKLITFEPLVPEIPHILQNNQACDHYQEFLATWKLAECLHFSFYFCEQTVSLFLGVSVMILIQE